MGEARGDRSQIAVTGVRDLTRGAAGCRERTQCGEFPLAAEPLGVTVAGDEDPLELCDRRDALTAVAIDEQRLDAVSRGEEAVLCDEFGVRQLLPWAVGALELERASDWTSAARAPTSSTVVCASMTRTSTVPSRGCRRASHHSSEGSAMAPDASERRRPSGPSRSSRESCAVRPCAGTRRRGWCGSTRSPWPCPARTGSWPTTRAAAAGAREGGSAVDRRAGLATPTWTCVARVGSRRASTRIDSSMWR